MASIPALLFIETIILAFAGMLSGNWQLMWLLPVTAFLLDLHRYHIWRRETVDEKDSNRLLVNAGLVKTTFADYLDKRRILPGKFTEEAGSRYHGRLMHPVYKVSDEDKARLGLKNSVYVFVFNYFGYCRYRLWRFMLRSPFYHGDPHKNTRQKAEVLEMMMGAVTDAHRKAEQEMAAGLDGTIAAQKRIVAEMEAKETAQKEVSVPSPVAETFDSGTAVQTMPQE